MTDIMQCLLAALDAAHEAARMIDAADMDDRITERMADAASDAVVAIERVARRMGHILPEFREVMEIQERMRLSGAQT